MSKILLFTDNHFCKSTSIVKKIGNKYPIRLENQIQSINWLEQEAVNRGCSHIICLGDFFERPMLTDVELTALKDVAWSDLPHYFLVGNHESEDVDLHCSSTKALEAENRVIVSEATTIDIDNCKFKFLPYVVERNRKQIAEYFGDNDGQRSVILSHNDIKGIQMGPVVTKTGFDIEDIYSNCNLFINGHLHNGGKVSKNIINLGNLTGEDFKEDANKYKHNIMVLDTDTLTYELVENPYAFNFYNIEINSQADIDKLAKISAQNAMFSVKCIDTLLQQTRAVLEQKSNVICFRIMSVKSAVLAPVTSCELNASIDCFAELTKFCKSTMENSQILDFELSEICK